MSNPKISNSSNVTVTTWKEAIPTSRFRGDKRGHVASISPQQWPIGDVSTAPEKLRESLGKNLRNLAFPYTYAIDSDGRLESSEMPFCSMVSPQWSVVICPAMGGRIMSIYHRGLDAELLWNQPTNWRSVFGLAGAWSIGGTEYNANRLGHQVHGLSCLKTEQCIGPDGQTSIRFGAFDELFDSEWSVTVSLLSDRVRTHIRFVNHASKPVPGYWWSNIAVPGSPRTRVMLEPGPMLHHGHHGGFEVSQWPRISENDWSEWRNHDDILSGYAYETHDGRMGYLDRDRGFAMVHYADPAICLGRKLWTIGAFYDKVAWWDRLSEPGVGSYYELQCGRRPTQLEADLLEPGQIVEWDEDYAAIPLCQQTPDYHEQWAHYTKATHFIKEDARRAAPQPTSPDRREQYIVLTPADERLVLSERIVRCPSQISDGEAQLAAQKYWLAGEHWMGRLAALRETSPEVHLKYGAALLADGQSAPARKELEIVIGKTAGESLAWAHMLLGIIDQRQGKKESAAMHFSQAIQHCPDLIEARLELHEALAALNRTTALAPLWRECPKPQRLHDLVTIAEAETAFLKKDWSVARTLLDREFCGVSEGDHRFWTLRREVELANAISLFNSGEVGAAANMLAAAAVAMPHYGTGRSEAIGNTDLMFYRWFLALASGSIWQRQAALTAVLLQEQPPQTPSIAYALRVAVGQAHPAAQRLRKVALEAPPYHTGVPNLRQAALAAADGDYTVFATLRSHRLYRYRAEFECSVIQHRLKQESVAQNQKE